MINTIIFDFGGVLVKDTVEHFENIHGWKKLSPQKKQQHEKNIRDCELGKISGQELMKRMAKIMAPALTAKDVEFYLEHHSKILPPFRLIPKLKGNYKLFILSNNFKGWPNKMWRALKVRPPQVPFINSAIIGARKQNGAAFNYIIKKYHLNPKQCLFIDDHSYNTAEAKKLGFKTFLYKNNDRRLAQYLKKFGIVF